MKYLKKNFKNLCILILVVVFIFSLNFVSARPLTCADNPLALWHFNEGSGNTTIDSCQGITATINGNYDWINGKYGQSILFNGIDTYADIGSQISQGFDEMSIMAWVRVDENNNPNYMSFVGRDYITEGVYVHNFALIKDFYYPDGFFFSIYPNNAHSFFSPYDLSDKDWHLLVGTYNGSEQNMSLYYDGNLVQSAGTDVVSLQSSTDYFLFGASFNNEIIDMGYFLNGSLDDVAIFNRTLSQAEISDYYGNVPINTNCSNITNLTQSINTLSFPYVAVSQNYPIEYSIFANNVPDYYGNMSIDINGTIFPFNWDFTSSSYKLTIFFNVIGDYNFIIYSDCSNVKNITGTFLVRQPFYVTFCGFEEKTLTPYKNGFAYLIAEYSTSKKYYDTNLEQFITPLGFATTYKTPVFHTRYTNGCGTLKLYEEDEYVIRLFDGIAKFPTTYSPPNITKSYGTNIYFGKYTFNSTNENINVYLSSKDIHPYFWIFNWTFIIVVGLTFIGSIFIFFMLPQYPLISLVFGLGFIATATLIRIILWFWIG